LEKEKFFLNDPKLSTVFHESIHFISRWLYTMETM
jgi:hypothetical protein